MLGISDISLLIVGSLLPVSTDKYAATIHLILLLVIIVIFSMILKHSASSLYKDLNCDLSQIIPSYFGI